MYVDSHILNNQNPHTGSQILSGLIDGHVHEEQLHEPRFDLKSSTILNHSERFSSQQNRGISHKTTDSAHKCPRNRISWSHIPRRSSPSRFPSRRSCLPAPIVPSLSSLAFTNTHKKLLTIFFFLFSLLQSSYKHISLMQGQISIWSFDYS